MPKCQGTVVAAAPEGTHDDRPHRNQSALLGKPVIRGTRIPVDLLLRKLSDGASEADLLDAYPRLTRNDLQAAIRYAAERIAHEEVVLTGPGSSTALD
ncbi:MAG: DUF433 domain-containing protein [Vicinamibacterales bacterium]